MFTFTKKPSLALSRITGLALSLLANTVNAKEVSPNVGISPAEAFESITYNNSFYEPREETISEAIPQEQNGLKIKLILDTALAYGVDPRWVPNGTKANQSIHLPTVVLINCSSDVINLRDCNLAFWDLKFECIDGQGKHTVLGRWPCAFKKHYCPSRTIGLAPGQSLSVNAYVGKENFSKIKKIRAIYKSLSNAIYDPPDAKIWPGCIASNYCDIGENALKTNQALTDTK